MINTLRIKKFSSWIFVISFISTVALINNICTASYIQPNSVSIIEALCQQNNPQNIQQGNPETTQENLSAIKEETTETGESTGTKRIVKTKRTTFNQELQWRILNLLTQQLFDNNHESVTGLLFSNRRTYATNTFSVSISSNNPDFYQVKILDSQLGSETQLEIPHL